MGDWIVIEVNPAYGADGSQLHRYTDGVARALAGPPPGKRAGE
jgi:hypothetical protein